jgi:phosphatidylglycerophosphate synthase
MLTNLRKHHIPWLMASARAMLGPFMVLGAACRWNGIALACMVVIALLSDIFDGVLARRWLCDTPAVRLFDTVADTTFYLGTAIALWIAHPQLIHTNSRLLIAVASLEVAHFAFDFARFGKPASYHSYLAKTWGLLLAISITAIFAGAGAYAATLFTIALYVGIACKLEGFTMSLMLPQWSRDVKTLRIAWHLRQTQLAN